MICIDLIVQNQGIDKSNTPWLLIKYWIRYFLSCLLIKFSTVSQREREIYRPRNERNSDN